MRDKLAEFGRRFTPCLTVHSWQLIDHAHELLQQQLRLDRVQARREASIVPQQQQQPK